MENRGQGERAYWLGWTKILWPRLKYVWALRDRFGSLKAAWDAPVAELTALLPQAPLAREVGAKRADTDPVAEAAALEARGINFITWDDTGYPVPLRNIYDPPPILFLAGGWHPQDALAVAIVGARAATPYGRAVAARLAEELGAVGVTVVSGLARGIDTAAHRGALEGGGRTIAVLGTGLDVVYPRENEKLLAAIAANGAVITEFWPGTEPQPWHFPLRNRLISGLARAVVVVEAGEKSGALITADLALEQGREVMAVPGNVTSRLSRGTNRLLKEGARLVESAADVLEELGLTTLFPREKARALPRLSREEETVWRAVGEEPLPEEVIIARTGLPPGSVMAALAFLEVKGLVRRLPGKFYVGCGYNR
ncbi:MAG: DNA-processing protein DprA [Bacillota bacterium]